MNKTNEIIEDHISAATTFFVRSVGTKEYYSLTRPLIYEINKHSVFFTKLSTIAYYYKV